MTLTEQAEEFIDEQVALQHLTKEERDALVLRLEGLLLHVEEEGEDMGHLDSDDYNEGYDEGFADGKEENPNG